MFSVSNMNPGLFVIHSLKLTTSKYSSPSLVFFFWSFISSSFPHFTVVLYLCYWPEVGSIHLLLTSYQLINLGKKMLLKDLFYSTIFWFYFLFFVFTLNLPQIYSNSAKIIGPKLSNAWLQLFQLKGHGVRFRRQSFVHSGPCRFYFIPLLIIRYSIINLHFMFMYVVLNQYFWF